MAGRIAAAVKLSAQLPAAYMSKQKTADWFGEYVDVLDDPEDQVEAQIRGVSEFVENDDEGAFAGADPSSVREALKGQATTYNDLCQLVHAVESLWEYRKMEQRRINIQQLTQHAFNDVHKSLVAQITHLQHRMYPLLQSDFLAPPSKAPGVQQRIFPTENEQKTDTQEARRQDADDIARIRQLYVPEILLGWFSALHSSGCMVSRDKLLDLLDATHSIAENECLTKCFVETGRMRELVDMVALSSKTLLRLNKENGKGGKRKKDARSMKIWDIEDV